MLALHRTFRLPSPSRRVGCQGQADNLWTAGSVGGIDVAGVVAAVGLVRGSNGARKALIAYALFGICFTIAKLIWWQETEALVFGGLDLVLIAVAGARPTCAYVA